MRCPVRLPVRPTSGRCAPSWRPTTGTPSPVPGSNQGKEFLLPTVDRAHDCLCNVDMGDVVQPDWMIRVKEDYFKSNLNMRSRELPEMLEGMDTLGVRRAVLLTRVTKPSKRAEEFVEARPDRFSLGLGGHNLLKPMLTLKALESFVASNPVAYISV